MEVPERLNASKRPKGVNCSQGVGFWLVFVCALAGFTGSGRIAATQETQEAAPVPALLRYHTYPTFTRVVVQTREPLTATPSLEYSHAGQRYEGLVLETSRPLGFPQGRFPLPINDGVVRQIRLEGNSRLKVDLGPRFTDYRIFYLETPYRLVVDLHRRRGDAPQGSVPLPPVADRRPGPQGQRVLILDPAHGGADAGRRGDAGAVEKTLVLEVAQSLQRHLLRLGQRVVLTRQGDYDLPVRERDAVARVSRARLWISLHVGGERGIRVYHWAPPPSVAPRDVSPWDRQQETQQRESARLALALRRSLSAVAPVSLHRVPLRGLAGVAVPAAAVEFGLGTETEPGILDAQTRARWVEATVRGIQDYLQEEASP